MSTNSPRRMRATSLRGIGGNPSLRMNGFPTASFRPSAASLGSTSSPPDLSRVPRGWEESVRICVCECVWECVRMCVCVSGCEKRGRKESMGERDVVTQKGGWTCRCHQSKSRELLDTHSC